MQVIPLSRTLVIPLGVAVGVLVVGVLVFFPALGFAVMGTAYRPFRFWGVGTLNTFLLFLGSALLGLLLGFFVGWGRASGIPFVSLPLLGYVEGLRGIPRLAIILLAASIFPAIGLRLSWAVLWGILALGISSGAYQGEVFRSGFASISRGQVEAATSLGMTYWQTMQHVTLPQVVRTVLPPLGNEWIIVLKDTALLVILPAVAGLAVPDNFELTKVAQTLQRATPIVALWPLFFLGAASIYFTLTAAISKTIQWLEEWFQVPGLGVASQ